MKITKMQRCKNKCSTRPYTVWFVICISEDWQTRGRVLTISLLPVCCLTITISSPKLAFLQDTLIENGCTVCPVAQDKYQSLTGHSGPFLWLTADHHNATLILFVSASFISLELYSIPLNIISNFGCSLLASVSATVPVSLPHLPSPNWTPECSVRYNRVVLRVPCNHSLMSKSHYPCSRDEEIEAQKGEIICAALHKEWEWRKDLDPGLVPESMLIGNQHTAFQCEWKCKIDHIILLPKSPQWHKGLGKSWILNLLENTPLTTLTKLSSLSLLSLRILFSVFLKMRNNPQASVHLIFSILTLPSAVLVSAHLLRRLLPTHSPPSSSQQSQVGCSSQFL